MRVVTWNLRTDTAAEPPHWPDRLPDVAAVLADLAPLVIGTQEGSAAMLDDLTAALPAGYTWVGEGRCGGRQDELTAVLVDTTRLEVLSWATTWLSEQPDVPGSVSWGSAFPRTMTTVRVRDRQGTACTVVNTHLDHVSGEARLRSAGLIVATLPDEPTIVLGDFNAPAVPDPEGPYAVLLGAGLVDTVALHAPADGSLGTFTDFAEPRVGAPRIDWVLASAGLRVESGRVVADGVLGKALAHGRHPSDHLPVLADVSSR